MSEALGTSNVDQPELASDNSGLNEALALESNLENAQFDELYAALENRRAQAVRDSVVNNLDALIKTAEEFKTRIASTLGQPGITNALDAHLITLDPNLAFTQSTPELDKAMAEILDVIRRNQVLTEDEKQLLVTKLNANNGPNSNYKL